MFNLDDLPDLEDEYGAIDRESYYNSLNPELPESLPAGCVHAEYKLSTGNTYLDETWFTSFGQVRRVPEESVDVFKTI